MMARNQGCNSDGEIMSSAFVWHDPVDTDVGGPSLTRQEFQEECDVNSLMARYEKTGVISHMNTRTPRYLDLSDVPDLHSAMSIMAEADAAFMALPAAVRLTFANDVQEFVKFAEDPANLEQMRDWGLAKPAEPIPAPMKVEVVNPQLDAQAAPAAAPGATK